MTARYLEAAPRADLAEHVHCVWLFEGEDGGEDQRVAPDGRCELIVHFGAPYGEVGGDGDVVRQPAAVFAGQLTRPLTLRADGRAGVAAVRFKPAGAWAFTGRPLGDLTDRRADLVELHGEAAVRGLVEAVAAADSDAARLAVLQAYVAARIAERPEWRDEAAERAVERLEDADGRVEPGALAREIGVSPRQLQRRFAEVVGVSPRALASVFRFRRVFDALSEADAATWSEAAQAAGYFDHPQMARDFRRFVGCTPTEFVAARPGLATSLADLP